MNQYPLLTYISIFSSVLPICVGISKIKVLHRGTYILLFYLIFAFVADIYFIWFVRGYQFALGLHHVYYLIEYIFIMSVVTVWQESRRIKKLFQVLMLLYVIFWIIAKVTFEPLNGLYSVTASASQVLLTLCAGYTLFVVMGNRMLPLTSHHRFWMILSFVVYYAGTLLIISLRGILIHFSTENFLLVSSIDWSLKIIFNILITRGFLCPQTQT